MIDLFNQIDIESIHDYKLAVINTRSYKYLCFMKEKPETHTLVYYLQRSDIVIRDGEIIKNKWGIN